MAKNKFKKEDANMADETGYGEQKAEEAEQETPKKEKGNKKLSKGIVGSVVTITEGTAGTVMEFDFAELPADIQAKLGPFGLGHKLGDAAAGKSGQDAVNAINKVFDGLMKDDWSVRAPAAEKVSKSDLITRIGALSDDEQAVAKAMLAKLGIKM
jgi:phage FluMu gp28-like protein